MKTIQKQIDNILIFEQGDKLSQSAWNNMAINSSKTD